MRTVSASQMPRAGPFYNRTTPSLVPRQGVVSRAVLDFPVHDSCLDQRQQLAFHVSGSVVQRVADGWTIESAMTMQPPEQHHVPLEVFLSVRFLRTRSSRAPYGRFPRTSPFTSIKAKQGVAIPPVLCYK